MRGSVKTWRVPTYTSTVSARRRASTVVPMSREGTEYRLPSTLIVLKRLTLTRNSRQGARGTRGKGRSAACSCWKRAVRVSLRLRARSCTNRS